MNNTNTGINSHVFIFKFNSFEFYLNFIFENAFKNKQRANNNNKIASLQLAT